MWNQPNLPTWPTWILVIFCQVSVPIKKWKSWKFYRIMKAFKIMTAQTMDPLAWTTNHYNLWDFETALIRPVLVVIIWNFAWGLISGSIYYKKPFQWKFRKLHLWWSAKIVTLTTSIFFTFLVGYNFIRENPEGLRLIAAILYQDMSELKIISRGSDQL